MQIHDDHDGDVLVTCRLAMVGLHADAIKREYSEAFAEIKRRCMACGFRQSCAAEVMRDPYNLAWEGYCPNSAALNALVALAEIVN